MFTDNFDATFTIVVTYSQISAGLKDIGVNLVGGAGTHQYNFKITIDFANHPPDFNFDWDGDTLELNPP